MTNNSIDLCGVSKSFGSSVAVHPLDMAIREGEFLTLLGPSGCGKTTTLRMIAGLESVSKGEIFLGGKSVTDSPPNRRNVAIMFQDYALFPHLTVRDNVAYGLKMQGLNRWDRHYRADQWLERMGLAPLAQRFPAELSGGQKQRTALARALVTEPGALLLDEPLSALDANLRAQLRDELRRIHREVGTTFVCVTHDQDEAMALSDRIAVMRDGWVEQIGTPDEIYDRPANAFVATFFGNCGLWDAAVSSADAGTCAIDGVVGETRFCSLEAMAAGTPLQVVVRPEALMLASDGHAPWVAGRLLESLTASGFHDLVVETDTGNTVHVHLPRSGDGLPAVGDRIELALRVDRLPALPAQAKG